MRESSVVNKFWRLDPRIRGDDMKFYVQEEKNLCDFDNNYRDYRRLLLFQIQKAAD